MKRMIILSVLAFPVLANGGVFKCVIDGVRTYSQTPCGDQVQYPTTVTRTGSPKQSFKDIDRQESKEPPAGLDGKLSKTE